MSSKNIIKFAIVLCLSLLFVACGKKSKQVSYPIESKVFTTLERTVVPVPVPSTSPDLKKLSYELSNYSKYGYGLWQFGEGLSFQKRLDLMPPGYTNTSVKTATHLMRFFAISDVHITDKESPAQAIVFGSYKPITQSAYQPSMLYTTQVFDAAVQTINALHKKNDFDFGISLGDNINNQQYNELRWYIDVLAGKVISPSSGNHAGADTIDYQKPFKAAGLDKTIPWYMVIGNHDHFWMGYWTANDYVRQHHIGENILNLGFLFTDPLNLDSRGYYMGAVDGRTPYGNIIGAGPVKDFTTPPKVLAADPNRRSLLRGEYMSEFLNTSLSPKGHGFNQSNVEAGFACYTFEPKSDLPIKVIVLDDTQRDDDPVHSKARGYAHGSLDNERFDWLVKELDKGQTEGKLIIIAAHVPIGVDKPGSSTTAWFPLSPISHEKLIAKMNTYPNLILWLAGHRHFNTVTALKSPDVNHPELGFWQVETASLKNFPQQFRTFEIVYNSDNTVSIFTTNVDPAVKEGSLAAKSRSYALATYQIWKYGIPAGILPTGSYNAELVKQLTPEMQAKLKDLVRTQRLTKK